MLVFVLEWTLLTALNSLCAGDAAAPKEKVAVDLHLVVLADRDGPGVVFVPQLRRRRLQST